MAERPALSEPAHFNKGDPAHAIELAIALGFADAKIEVITPPSDHPQMAAIASAYRQFKAKPEEIRLLRWSATINGEHYGEALYALERDLETTARKNISLSMCETLLALVANRLLPQSTKPPLITFPETRGAVEPMVQLGPKAVP